MVAQRGGRLAAYSQLLEGEPRPACAVGSVLWTPPAWFRGLVSEQARPCKARRVGGPGANRRRISLFLSRLAWVLVKSGATADASAILDRAASLCAVETRSCARNWLASSVPSAGSAEPLSCSWGWRS